MFIENLQQLFSPKLFKKEPVWHHVHLKKYVANPSRKLIHSEIDSDYMDREAHDQDTLDLF